MSRARLLLLVFAMSACAKTTIAADIQVETKWQKNQGLVWADRLHKVTGRTTIPVYAGDLLREYSQNEVAADKRFQGSLLVVTGQVNRIVKDEDGHARLIMTAPDIEEQQLFRSYLVICQFKQEDAQLLADRKQGDFIHCAGKCLGLKEFLGDIYVYLDDCGAIEREYQRKFPEYDRQEQQRGAAAMAQYSAERKRKIAAETAEKKERASRGTLRFAKKFLAKGDKKSGREWLAKVVKRYPGTAAAKQATEILQTLDSEK